MALQADALHSHLMKLGYSWEVYKEKMYEQALTTEQSTALSVFDNDFQEFMDKFMGTGSTLGLPTALGTPEMDKSSASDYIKKVARKETDTKEPSVVKQEEPSPLDLTKTELLQDVTPRSQKLKQLFSKTELIGIREDFKARDQQYNLEMSEATQVTGVLHPVVCLGDDDTTTVEEQTRLEAKTKVVNLSATKTLIYGVLRESPQWNPKSFALDKNPYTYSEVFADNNSHVNWAAVKIIMGEPAIYFLVTVLASSSAIYFLESSCGGYNQWSRYINKATQAQFLRKDGMLNTRKVEKILQQHYGWGFYFHKLPNTKVTIDHLKSVDVTRSKQLVAIDIGILYRTTDQMTRREMFSNKTPSKTFDVFLNDLGIHRDEISEDGKASSEWAGKSVRWGIATHMNKEQQRKIIGNSLAVIIFNDSDKPLDISHLDLGEATNFICVVQKHYKYYRYELRDIAGCSSRQVVKWEDKLKSLKIDPEIPENYLFDKKSLRDFIMVKIHNAIMAASRVHPLIQKIMELPVQTKINEIIQISIPDWHSWVQGWAASSSSSSSKSRSPSTSSFAWESRSCESTIASGRTVVSPRNRRQTRDRISEEDEEAEDTVQIKTISSETLRKLKSSEENTSKSSTGVSRRLVSDMKK